MRTTEDVIAEAERDVARYLDELCTNLAGMEDTALDDRRPDLAALFSMERGMVEGFLRVLKD